MATEISSDLGLRVGANSTDHSGSEMPRPRTKNMAHAAGSRMDQNMISRLHLVRSMQEILRGHPLQDQSCQLNVIQWQVFWDLDQLVSRVKALLTIGAEWGKAGANSFADGEPGDARIQLLDHANSFETEDNRWIADNHRVRDTCSIVRISEIHADGRAAKTYLATRGNPHFDLLPHEVVGCAFLVDYRRHPHDAFLLLLGAFLLRGSQLSRANSWADAELLSIDMLAVSAIGLRMVAAAILVEVAALAGVAKPCRDKLCRERRHEPSSAAQSIARNSVSLKSA